MIPLGPPSPLFLPLLFAGQIGFVLLVIWLVRLARRPASRAAYRRRPWLHTLGLMLLAPVASVGLASWAIPGYVLVQGLIDLHKQHIVLDHRERIAGIEMPAGTRLTLASSQIRDDFTAANFPAETEVYGLTVTRIERLLRSDPGSDYSYRPEVVRLALDRAQMVQGWRCGTVEPVALDVLYDRPSPRLVLYRCLLADDADVPGLDIDLTGAELIRDGGDTGRTTWGWRLAFKGTTRSLGGLRLQDLVIMLDADRRPVNLSGTLERPGQLPNGEYPAGTGVRGDYQAGGWLFHLSYPPKFGH